ncbi:MAG: DUF3352 domain-containing protein [Clostridiales bacterium]|nr:DUF3352 domain-containing protein [Clostridiales bacterium]
MRKYGVLVLIVLTACFWTSCAKKPAGPQAGTAKAEDMLSLLPKDVRGVMVVDAHRIMELEAVKKAIQENENYPKYQEFIQETGIDPQKDIFFFVAAFGGEKDEESMQEGVALLNMKYNRDLLLAKLKKEGTELTETVYDGVTIYKGVQAESQKPFSGAFLDDSNIAVGTDAHVKKVIDVHRKKAENILKNQEISNLIKGMNKSAMAYGAFLIPSGVMKGAASQNPMLSVFESITSIILAFDYKDKTFLAEIKAQSPDPAKNKQIADTLNGFKALGAAAASKEPELGELLNRVEIASAADSVKITASIPEETAKSLGEKMKAQKAKPQNPEN